MPNPDVLEAIGRANDQQRQLVQFVRDAIGLPAASAVAQAEDDIATLITLAADIKAYREAWCAFDKAYNAAKEDSSPETLRTRAMARARYEEAQHALLARCRGEQPHQPQEENT